MLLSRPAREYVLQGALADVKRDYDIILLDCSPSLGVLTLNALTAAHALIIPMPCEMLSHRGVGQLLDTVRDVKKILNKKLKVLGILPTLRPAGAHAPDPEDGPVRRGSRRGAFDPVDGPHVQGRHGLPRGRGRDSDPALSGIE